MSGYVSELLDYLDLYKVLLENHFYSDENNDKANELIRLIESLNTAYDNKDLSSYNFVDLKRTLSILFHPDRNKIMIPEGLNINSLELLSKTNGIIDSIERETGRKNAFDYNEAEPFSTPYERRYEEYTNNDYYYDDIPFEQNEEYVRKEKEKIERQEKFDKAVEKIKDGIIKTKDYICLISKERFNAMFRSIPSNSKDYFNIKKRFENSLNNLTSRVNVLQSTLMILNSNMTMLNNNFQNEVSDYNMEMYYNNLLKYAQADYNKKDEAFRKATNRYNQVIKDYSPVYNGMINYWLKETGELLTDIINVDNEIYEKQFYGNDKKEIKLLEKRRKKLNKEKDEYLTFEEMQGKAIEYLKENYPDYKEAIDTFNKTRAEYNKARSDYTYLLNHKQDIQKEQYQRIYKDYNNKYIILDLRIKGTKSKRDRLARTIYNTKIRYNDFIDKYSEIYDKEYENEEVHSSRK